MTMRFRKAQALRTTGDIVIQLKEMERDLSRLYSELFYMEDLPKDKMTAVQNTIAAAEADVSVAWQLLN